MDGLGGRAGLAGSADGLGRRHAAQNLSRLGDALETDLPSALVEHPISVLCSWPPGNSLSCTVHCLGSAPIGAPCLSS